MTHPSIARIAITPGEPAGIGPDILVQLAQQTWPAELIAIADPDLLLARAKQLSLSLHLSPFDPKQAPSTHQPGHLKIREVKLAETAIPGTLNTKNASYVTECLRIAADLCLDRTVNAMTTGPVQKSIINEANIPFTGHTEFLAQHCQRSEYLMLFVVDQCKIALATTHLPLALVPQAITQEKLMSSLRLLNQSLKEWFRITEPAIYVCGLNPHAGENGHLGREEIDVIQPALEQLRKENIKVYGPLSADTIFTDHFLKKADAIFAMYHDQALPVVKYMSFGQAVNITLGLPILRTSVDHGTALDLAGTGLAQAGSLAAAVHTAIQLTTHQQ